MLLENLKPRDGLHAIRIHSYEATTFPTWMSMLQNIVHMHLFGCEQLQWLFRRDSNISFAFPNLKQLTLQDLVSLERWWGTDNDVMQEEILFPQLEKLVISRYGKLTTLPGHPTFPNLQGVRIEGCPELITEAKSPKLSVLNMEGHVAELFLWVARHMTSLTNLELTSIEHSTDTTSMGFENSLREVVNVKENGNDQDFPLEVLVLRDFKSGLSVTELCACFVHLQDLSIMRCHELVHWPETLFEGLVSLRKLRIEQCNNLTGYAQVSAEPSTSSETIQLLPLLESLEIWSCENLVELFTSGRKLQLGQSVSSIHQGSSNVDVLTLDHCDGLTRVLYFPPSLKRLDIHCCGGLALLDK